MVRLLFALIVTLFFSAAAFSEETVYFKIANQEGYINFFSYSEAARYPFVKEIAQRTLKHSFNPERVNAEYYQLLVSRGLVWQGKGFIQYDYRAINGDRFRHVLWVGEASPQVLKLDIYDTEGKLLYSALNFDGNEKRQEIKKGAPAFGKEPGYFGFINLFTEQKPDGTLRMLFTDGLNAFSVFKFPLDFKGDARRDAAKFDIDKTEKLIVYGNYLYRVKTDKFRYMVVGSVPFSTMERVVELIDSSDAEFEKCIHK